jgi:hypothetical protein
VKPSHTLLLALVLAPLAACAGTKPPPEAYNEGLEARRDLAAVNPADVVVLPIENQTGRSGLPLDELRREFHEGLVKLHYSPLALDYVDSRVVDATYVPGDLREEGIFRVFLTGWDDSNWKTRTRLVIDADVYLLDSNRPEIGSALWGGHVQRVMEMGQVREVASTERALMERTVELFVSQVLASLPARDPTRSTASR